MKVRLVGINAKFIHTNLAIRSLKAYTLANTTLEELDLDICEFTMNQRLDFILKSLIQEKPDLLGFSCYLWNIQMVKDLIHNIHKILPNTKIILGGPEVSYDAENVLKELPEVTAIVCGEGEETFKQIVEALYEGRAVEPFPKDAPLEMDELVFSYQLNPKLSGYETFPFQILYYETARGCPFNCQYCLSSIEKGVRFRSMLQVRKELNLFLKAKVNQVKFVDRTFNSSKKHAMAIWKYLHENDNGVTNFHFEISADLLDDATMVFLKTVRPGLFQFEVGVQTIHESVLETISRKTHLDKLRNNVLNIYEGRNIHLHLDLIAGLPGESYEQFKQSFNWVYALKPDQLQLGFLKVLKGSGLMEKKDDYGLVFRDYAPYEILQTNVISYTSLEQLKVVEEMVERYNNSGLFRRTLQYLMGFFQTPFDFFEQLGDFYVANQYEGMNQSKIQNYEILRTFGMSQQVDPFVLDQLLKLDLFLHERLKKLPNWLPDESVNVKMARALLETDEIYDRILKQIDPKVLRGKEPTTFSEEVQVQRKDYARVVHIEKFEVDILALMGNTGEKIQKVPGYLFIDYTQKDFVTQEARWYFKSERLMTILDLLDVHYGPEYKCYLNYKEPWQLLIATILSAQCTDDRVNMVTKDLFVEFPTLAAFALAPVEKIERAIHSTGFYKNKAKNIKNCCTQLLEVHQGILPSTIEELTALDGVGRKTANVVRGHIFNIESVVVDTHVKRISNKLELAISEDPVKIEFELMALLPRSHWLRYNTQIIAHGRRICTARSPKCGECFLLSLCSWGQNQH